MKRLIGWLMVSGSLLSLVGLHGDEITIWESGSAEAGWEIVLGSDPTEWEERAAGELSDYFGRMTGLEWSVVHGEGSGGLGRILVGSVSGLEVPEELNSGGYRLVIGPREIAVRGVDEQGTYYGAIEILERLGVRWFVPGAIGEVVPEGETLILAGGETLDNPAFPGRHLSSSSRQDPKWGARMRHGGDRLVGAHGIPPIRGRPRAQYFESNPEYFALIDGERRMRQLCVGNQEVQQLTLEWLKNYFRENPEVTSFGLGPNDGSGYCECELCLAMDGEGIDPYSLRPQMTDRYIAFFNILFDGLEEEFPEHRLGLYLYGATLLPPERTPIHPNFVGVLAAIHLERLHGVDNPNSPESWFHGDLFRIWGEQLNHFHDRGYWFNLADTMLPVFWIRRIQDEVQLARETGVSVIRRDGGLSSFSYLPTYYLASRLMWNPDADVQEILEDFTTKFFGPAAAPMLAYIELMEETIYNTPLEGGGSWEMPHIYPAEMRDEARALLGQAWDRVRGLGEDNLYYQRVDLCRKIFSLLDDFIAMKEGQFAVDLVASQEALDRLIATMDILVEEHSPTIIRPRHAHSFLRRFHSRPTESGSVRVTGENRLVAPLDDEWDFAIDPVGNGELNRLFDPKVVGGHWRPIRAYSNTWSMEGLRYYIGDTWYRQGVELPEIPEGQRVHLWFGGVDRNADVWVNGIPVGTRRGAPYTPFEIDVTEVIRPGEENLVVVKAERTGTSELGIGGITGPVMFYAPGPGFETVVDTWEEEQFRILPGGVIERIE